MKIVISLGGSVIVPDKIDVNFLEKFKKIINKIKKGNKIVIVTGGGSTARKYIETLRDQKVDEMKLSYMGFRITKINGLFLSNFLGVRFADNLNEVKEFSRKDNLIVCGALEFNSKGTSDGTSSKVARAIKADVFVNITDVKGLYDKDPKKYKNAKLISKISFKDFSRIANKIKFMAGQHFVLDQRSARFIEKTKIKTIIIKDINNLEKIVMNKKFTGTEING